MAKRLQDLTPISTPDEAASVLVVGTTESNLLTVSNLRSSMLTKASESTLGAIKVGANLSISEDGTLSVNALSLPTQTGNNGKFLTTNGSTASWSTLPNPPSPYPSQAGKVGQFLMTNGTSVLWQPVPSYEALPAKTGNAGKFLTTNGTTLSWSAVDAFPSQTGNFGRLLSTDGAGTTLWSNIISIVPTGVSNSVAVNLTRDLRLAQYTNSTRDTYLTAEPDGAIMWNTSSGELQVRKSNKWRGVVTKSYAMNDEQTNLATWGVDAIEVQELGEHTFKAWHQTESYLWRNDTAVCYWFRFVPSIISTAKLKLTIDILSQPDPSGPFSETPYNVYSGDVTILCQQTSPGHYIIKCIGTLVDARGDNKININFTDNNAIKVDGAFYDIPLTTTYNNDNFVQDPNAGVAVYKWEGFYTKRTHYLFIIGTVAA